MQPISNAQNRFSLSADSADVPRLTNSGSETQGSSGIAEDSTSLAEVPAEPDALITMNPEDFRQKLNSGTLPDRPILVTGDLKLTDNDDLAKLPARLTVNGDLRMFLCRSLKSLPPELAVRGSLFAILCTSLVLLPEVLNVGMDLDLEGCTSLTSLPETLTLGGNLSLFGCTSLRSLAKKLVLGGSINLEGCISVKLLPDYITDLGPQRDGQFRQVYITGIGLSNESINRLRMVEAPGVHFRYERVAINQRIYILP